MDNDIPRQAADAVGAASEAAEAVTAATAGGSATAATAGGSATAATALDALYYFVMVPMVYLAVAVMIAGIVARIFTLLRSPAPAYSLATYPRARRPVLAALAETLTMPSIRRRKPVFWVFLVTYHVGFLFLILGHLDLFPGVRLMPPESKHMLGAGGVGLAVTVPLLYFLIRRFGGEVRKISVPADYLLLLLLLFVFLLGDLISWGNSWTANGFVMTKSDFRRYFGILANFSFEDPRTVLHGSHYHFVVLHVFLAEIFMMLLPFTKVVHTFFSLPVNLLRRR